MTIEKLRVEAAVFVGEQYGGTLHRIVGWSMWPFLRSGMLVRVEPLIGEAKRGEILVYRTAGILIAHRLLRYGGSRAYVISGDAVPATLEEIAKEDILGRVTAVWPSGNPSDPRRSPAWLPIIGWLMIGSHPWRAGIAKILQVFEAFLRPHELHSGGFRLLIEATFMFVIGNNTRAVDTLSRTAIKPFLCVLGKHAMGSVFSRWLDGDAKHAEPILPLAVELRKTRIIASLSENTVLARVRDLIAILDAEKIPYILLKGAARFAASAPGADLHLSTDVDVLISGHAIDQAEQALYAAGYTHRLNSYKRREYYVKYEHHRPPLWPPNARIPIELHTEIARPGEVSQRLDFAALEKFAITVDGPVGTVWILNRVGRAIHLAYHADTLLPWRDILLLADAFKEMTPTERACFDDVIRKECKNAIRLQSAVVAADALNGYWRDTPDTTRYLNWVMHREELPLILKHRSGALEGFFSRTGIEFTGSYSALLKLWRWLLNLLSVPLIFVWCIRNRGDEGWSRWLFIRRKAELDKGIKNPTNVIFNDLN